MSDPIVNTDEVAADPLEGLFIPSPPDLFNEVRAATPNLIEIGKILATDAGLSSEVLRVVNSPAFGMRSPIASINHATSMLGLDHILNIVNGVLLRQYAKGVNSDDLNRFWQGASELADCCTLVARTLKVASPDEAFTLGLFCNCAVPLILQKHSDYLSTVEQSYACSSGDILTKENELFGNDHVRVSHLIAMGWFLPNHICSAIAEHHSVTRDMFDCEIEQDKKINQLIAVLKISEHLNATYQKLGGQSQDYEWQRIGVIVMEYLDLGEADYLALEEKVIALTANSIH